MLVSCENCKKEVNKSKTELKRSKNHFCTRSCAATFNNRGKNKRSPLARTCKVCQQKYENRKGYRSQAFCPKCRSAVVPTRTVTIGEYRTRVSVRDKHPSWLHSHVRTLNKSWNRRLGTSCQRCEYSIHVELAHIKAISSFPNSAILGEVNSPDNLLVLCRNCHWEYDNGKLALESIPRRKPLI